MKRYGGNTEEEEKWRLRLRARIDPTSAQAANNHLTFSELKFPRKQHPRRPIGVGSGPRNVSRICLGVHVGVGRCGPRRRPLLIAFAARVIDAKIVLRVLVEILGGNAIAARCGFACQGEVALEYLVGAAADLDAGPVAVECLIVLRVSRLLSEWAICVKAAARPLIWS
jgi:hypothetical protein